MSRIKPGYVIMSKSREIQSSPGSTQHAKLFHHFFGQTPEELRTKNIEFVAIGFSYQARDRSNTDVVICDFKFTSGTFNSGRYFADASKIVTTGTTGTTRSIDWQMENLLRLVINKWRIKDPSDLTRNAHGRHINTRGLIKISEIYNADNFDKELYNPNTNNRETILPACPNIINRGNKRG